MTETQKPGIPRKHVEVTSHYKKLGEADAIRKDDYLVYVRAEETGVITVTVVDGNLKQRVFASLHQPWLPLQTRMECVIEEIENMTMETFITAFLY